jgi:hypothetical protein
MPKHFDKDFNLVRRTMLEETFPRDKECPFCHNNDNKECVSVPVAGTEDIQSPDFVVIHASCLESHWVWSRDLNMLVAQAS